MRSFGVLARWSGRDLRAHWAKVLAIAVVIALGTGGYAGLTSTAEWRRQSYDTSYRQLAMYDLRIDLAHGSFVTEGTLAGVVAAIPTASSALAVEERLVVPTQVDASTAAETVLVRGELTGSDFGEGGPHVNGYHAFTGRLLDAGDAGAARVMIDRNFARHYALGASGTVAVSGGRTLEMVGQATTPEYFYVAPEGEMFMTEATFAGLFTTLATAQDVAGLPGQVNNLVLTLVDGADRDAVAAEIEDALAGLPVGTDVKNRDDNLSYTALTTDVDQDQAMFNALAALLFLGAVGAAFNLVHRLVEQQRREIGIGMAIGVRPGVLAVRPLLVTLQIALLGVAFGVMVGTLIGAAMGGLLEDFVPLPVWDTSFQTGVFLRVAVIGLVVPFVAGAIPVVRALRVSPVEAIRPDLTGGRGAVRRAGRRVRNTFAVMPFRNLRRTPRRTALTTLGIAAAITVLVGFLGIMDSVFGAVDRAEAEAVGTAPDRIEVGLDTFRPIAGPAVGAVVDAGSVGRAEPALRMFASVSTAADEFDLVLQLSDFAEGMWRPSLTSGGIDRPGLLLSEKAAADLGVAAGGTVVLRHPRRMGPASFSFVDTEIAVAGTHPHPVRAFAYMDGATAGIFNMDGLANALNVLPADGATTVDVQRELFPLDWVTSVQSVTAVTDAVQEAFEQMLAIIQVMVAAVLLLALLIAFNTAAINLDARSREHATMFAFGVRVRTALRMAVTESFVIGVVATAIGVAGGLAMVWWMTKVLLAETLPEFALGVILRPSTMIVVVVMGIVAVTAAPLFVVRRMRRMDLPGTLRLVE